MAAMNVNDFVSTASFPWAFRLAYVGNMFREPLLKVVEERWRLSRPEWTVLLCVMIREGIISKDIWELTGQPRNSISRGVISLEKRGLVRRTPSSHDKRQVALHPTAEGARVFGEIEPLFVQREGAYLSCLTGEELTQFQTILTKLSDHISSVPEPQEQISPPAP
ncbi:MarR family winged helix-turn-helix transcriptional regulator [Stappia indica]|nr:MarR family transcriptional regulator [Stappia indica]MCC4245240.1 MarR family transcriptional regulator [Stappia indica]